MGRPRKDVASDVEAMLTHIRRLAPGPRSASVASLSSVARELGWSVGKVKLVRAAARDEGLLEVEERWGENGAQLENAYRLTRKGRRLLASREDAREKAVVGE